MPSVAKTIPKPRPSPVMLLTVSALAAAVVVVVAAAVLNALQGVLPGGLPFGSADSALWWAQTGRGL